jgi:L-asparagine transporter-like permease
MRSLFGALFGLIIGSFVSVLLNLKNNQLGEVLKEVFKNTSYISLIIAFAILGWLIGMSQWKKTQIISSTKEGDKKESSQYNSIEWEASALLILVILGVLASLDKSHCLAFIFIILNEILWIFWILIRHDRIDCKWFRKSPPAESEDKNKQKPG